MKIRKDEARALLYAQAQRGDAPDHWVKKVTLLSQMCEEGTAKTHLAFLATAMLAKASNGQTDLWAIKPTHAPDSARAYSARVLCHSVIVPMSAEIGFSIGVTGREPLNNQPYFRMTRLDDGTPVHPGGRAAFDYMLQLVKELADGTEEEAQDALAAFIAVRKSYQPKYAIHDSAVTCAPWILTGIIERFVGESSQNGRRAQAVAAGLSDVAYGAVRVKSGRINDPSRNHPGDVCILNSAGDGWEKAMEVRDKPVTASDIQIFGRKCLELGVRDSAFLMVSRNQKSLDYHELQR